MLTIGDKAPDFSLKDENGNNISRSNLEGKKTILYFLIQKFLLYYHLNNYL